MLFRACIAFIRGETYITAETLRNIPTPAKQIARYHTLVGVTLWVDAGKNRRFYQVSGMCVTASG